MNGYYAPSVTTKQELKYAVILDSYDKLTIVEKNDLWKIVMERITVFRTPEGEFSMHIYPKLPMPT